LSGISVPDLVRASFSTPAFPGPHPAAGVFDVAGIPGDEVDVQVHHRLAGGGADVDADVVAGRKEPAVEEGFRLPEEREEAGQFRVEEAGDVPVGDEEEVAGTDWISIITGVAEVVGEDDLVFLRVAERAGQRDHASYPRTWMR